MPEEAPVTMAVRTGFGRVDFEEADGCGGFDGFGWFGMGAEDRRFWAGIKVR